MNTIISLCLVLVCSTSVKNNVHGIVIGSLQFPDIQTEFDYFANIHPASLFDLPYHVAVVETNTNGNKRLVCQGALITKKWFLTSAYCIWAYNSLSIEHRINTTIGAVMGTRDYTYSQATKRSLSYYAYHPQFNKKTGIGYDAALWMLNEPLLHLSFEGTIQLYDSSDEMHSDCIYSSYLGENLYWNKAEITKNYSCKVVNGVFDSLKFCWIMNRTLLINNESLGSPLACKNYLHAIRSKNGFSVVLDIRNWVENVMEKELYLGYRIQLAGDIPYNLSIYDLGAIPIERVNYNNESFSMMGTIMSFVKPIFQSVVLNNPFVFTVETSQEHQSNEETIIEKMNGIPADNEIEMVWNKDDVGKLTEAPDSNNQPRIVPILRKRRGIMKTVGIENVFLSWAQTINRLSPRRQVKLKSQIADLLSDAQSEEIDYQEINTFDSIGDELSKEVNIDITRFSKEFV